MTNIVQQASLQFIEDYLKTFGQFRDNMVLQNIPLSAPFEYYLHNSKAFDRQLFSTLPFEDSLGAEKILHALDFWNNDIAVYKLDIHTQNNSELPDVIKDINLDGLFVKFYKRMNKWFPKGRRSRKIVKKIGSIFFH